MPWLVWAIVASGLTSYHFYRKSKNPLADNGSEPR
jgi:hypothetical protein